ncbi:G5 domain-containing protein [Bifidobacterium sp. 82T10]|uniref:G5 domain-containing protein n=1 Tax=Bifidobacterium miconis TaxID=2834435 RepID=A0ABS6WFH4_9BIFI|nr:G5 domain-containing protein [Bifidobacterium miconis]MBW3092775.1 G5 domain-containing protein [Bifidobacterium miconis]MBW3092789.1 G5 domain-containing protein [Bifidobacterium miconis]
MARRWTPQRFVKLRRIRVAASALIVLAVSLGMFQLTARKTVAITVNGETTTVTTYAMSASRLLESQGIDVKTHDIVESSAGGEKLTNHSVVTVQSAYQTTISIDGQEVPFWTTATSAAQLLGFFEANEHAAAKVTVNIDNIYSKLTGGLVINADGPVTVIADGKSSVAPNGKLPAASILDSKGITLGKEDRVSVEKDGGKTILRVQRVTHGEETRTVAIPHGTQTIEDPSLAAGTTVVRQQGEDGEKRQTYSVTYVDGKKESEQLKSETTTKIAIDTIVAVGTKQPETSKSDDANDTSGNADSNENGDAESKNDATGDGSSANGSNGTTGSSSSSNGSADKNTGSGSGTSSNGSSSNGSSNGGTSGKTDSSASGSNGSGNSGNGTSGNTNGGTGNNGSKPNSGSSSGNGSSGNAGNSGNSGNSNNAGNGTSGNTNANNSGNSGSSGTNNGGSGNSNTNSNTNSGSSSNDSNSSSNTNSGSGSSGSGSDSGSSDASNARLWRPTAAQAQAYAAGAAAQRGWTGDDWTALVKLWNRESGWSWSAENASSGAYGIPQALPGSKMADFGADWKNDAAVQIDWGLSYIAQRYGTPSKAWEHSEKEGWY